MRGRARERKGKGTGNRDWKGRQDKMGQYVQKCAKGMGDGEGLFDEAMHDLCR